MPRVFQLTSVLAMLLAAIPAHAQVYKWVDERGVSNYSSAPPAAITAKLKPAIVADRISVYPSEPGLQRALAAISASKERALSDRIDLLERQLAAERQSSQYAAAAEARAAQAAYAQCLADRRVDCDDAGGYYPYGAGGVATVIHHQPRFRVATKARSGVIAGDFKAAIKVPRRNMHARRGVADEDIVRSHSGGRLRRSGVARR